MDNSKQEKKERKRKKRSKTIMKRKVDPFFLTVQCYRKAPCAHMKRGADSCSIHHYYVIVIIDVLLLCRHAYQRRRTPSSPHF